MQTALAQAIRAARRASGLTQSELGLRLGLKGRAIYRWERDASAPRSRHHRALVAALHGIDPQLIAALTAALTRPPRNAPPAPISAPAPATPTPPAPAPAISVALTVELCLFRLADELDVPPRRVRAPLSRLLQRARAATLTLEVMAEQLDAMIASAATED